MENNVQLGTIDPKPYKITGQLKYLVLILNRKQNELNQFIGFVGYGNTMCVQWFDGTEDFAKGIVQTPKLFDTKEEAQKAVEEGHEHNNAFREENVYEIVPIEVQYELPKFSK